jgi:hypothetical protein
MTPAWWKTYREILLMKTKRRGFEVTLKPVVSCPNLDPDIWARDQHGAIMVLRQGCEKGVK